MKNEYMTKQRKEILNYIRKINSFTIKDLEQSLPNIGTTTIYREINNLLSKKDIIKTVESDNTTKYQYIGACHCTSHMYLKCSQCGSIEHIDCDFIGKIKQHIKKDHGFQLDTESLVIAGTCKKCIKKGDKK